MKIIIFTIILISIMLQACVEPFEPDIDKYENILVIDGLITNNPGPYQVKVTRSYPYNKNHPEMVENAIIKIIDNRENEYPLNKVLNKLGTYETDSNFQAQVGTGYKLQVITPDNNIYECDFETINNPVEIDTIYYSLQYKFNVEEETNIIGAQLYLDTHDPNNNTRYYAWEYEETWKFGVRYHWAGHVDRYYCYRSFKPKELLLGTSDNLINDEIRRFPLTFIGANTPKLKIKYSILVKQYSLSQKAYQYFNYLKSVNESGGSLFDKTPTSVYGNMYNINNPNEPVLGLFQVSGVSKKRIFIEKSDFDEYFYVESGFGWCKDEYSLIGDSLKTDSLLKRAFIIIDTSFTGDIHFTRDSACFDCTKNGTNIVPDFWED